MAELRLRLDDGGDLWLAGHCPLAAAIGCSKELIAAIVKGRV